MDASGGVKRIWATVSGGGTLDAEEADEIWGTRGVRGLEEQSGIVDVTSGDLGDSGLGDSGSSGGGLRATDLAQAGSGKADLTLECLRKADPAAAGFGMAESVLAGLGTADPMAGGSDSSWVAEKRGGGEEREERWC